VTVIVRYELDNGDDTYATVPASMADQIGDMRALTDALLVAIPRAACIQVWADGKSFLDPPDAEARSPQPDPAPTPSDLVLDVATAIMLTEADRTAPMAGAPAWLTRSRSTPRLGPQVLRGRATGATGNVPPVQAVDTNDSENRPYAPAADESCRLPDHERQRAHLLITQRYERRALPPARDPTTGKVRRHESPYGEINISARD
jgi:hypothetical protein